jgi:hypothetical protein
MRVFRITVEDQEGYKVQRDLNLYRLYIEDKKDTVAAHIFEMYETLTDREIKF